ncbi:NADP-dependent alcohol dehydrogenase C 2 [Cladobotryum mycophilum]|uniref:NADP-dependent alcohol dehydrogenase C 2 n=1 Tax=Cladobotryum mycophilum TaxID=491253 RepID=A0ABR0SHU5_9HYPO
MTEITFDVFRGTEGVAPVQRSVTKKLRPNDVHFEITHSGLCGTDLHFRHADIALGHEGVGIVRTVGEAVRDFKVGDVVGFGYVREVCGHCTSCLTGWDQYCPNSVAYGAADFDTGSFSQGAVVDARCVFHIPFELDPAEAAPLMCGGGTVWTILSQYGIKPTDRVGVMGIGGLGHIAIKMAAAMGCHVVVLSSSESKREEAIKFGAQEFHVFRQGEKFEGDIAPINHLLLTGSSQVDYAALIPLMAANGAIYPLSVDFSPSEVVMFHLGLKGVRIQASAVVSSTEMRKMLQFCALHSIVPQIQKFPLSSQGIVDAMQVLTDGKVRYRAVLVAQT